MIDVRHRSYRRGPYCSKEEDDELNKVRPTTHAMAEGEDATYARRKSFEEEEEAAVQIAAKKHSTTVEETAILLLFRSSQLIEVGDLPL
ncbi:hypothetical protein BHE74_00052322 [Ensete ventricosum]|uniref:Uncharacterized protein n=1 Tax=Ensete ventricosum TaxID=4639 RepID=A0A444E924_ENSVE|nr:hypothetical protein B296_00027714 [Ensete ventricosum]RWW06863.1 hypothetical protein GW17_00029781 [Ensete ventricosum]RWW42149.1 hypothetical protein BHE74_00052322 [Ensete ventricosum]RZS24121.1 hypothetical protein BHM03_00057155 [Ensete ventricosum]